MYVFGKDPALFDRGETAPNMSAIRQIRFCEGLSEEPEPLPRCADIEDGPNVRSMTRGWRGTALSSSLTSSAVTEAHIHFSQAATNGGIIVFLCSNLDDSPAAPRPVPKTMGR